MGGKNILFSALSKEDLPERYGTHPQFFPGTRNSVQNTKFWLRFGLANAINKYLRLKNLVVWGGNLKP